MFRTKSLSNQTQVCREWNLCVIWKFRSKNWFVMLMLMFRNFLSIMSSSGIASTETSIFFVFFDFSSNVAASFVLSQVCLILQNLLLCRPQSRRARHLVRVRLVYFYINVIVIPQFRLHSCLQPPLHPRFSPRLNQKLNISASAMSLFFARMPPWLV